MKLDRLEAPWRPLMRHNQSTYHIRELADSRCCHHKGIAGMPALAEVQELCGFAEHHVDSLAIGPLQHVPVHNACDQRGKEELQLEMVKACGRVVRFTGAVLDSARRTVCISRDIVWCDEPFVDTRVGRAGRAMLSPQKGHALHAARTVFLNFAVRAVSGDLSSDRAVGRQSAFGRSSSMLRRSAASGAACL